MKSMRVCLVNTNLQTGGAERQLVQLVRYWHEGDTLSVVLLERKGVWLKEIPSSVPVYALTEQMPKSFLLKVFWALRLVPRMRRWLLENPCDIVLTFLWLPTVLVALALRGLPDPPLLVWSVQSDLGKEFRLHPDRLIRKWLLRAFVTNRVNCFVAVSQGIGYRTSRFLNVPLGRIAVIPNGVDLKRIEEMARKDREGVSKHLLRIITVGRLHPAKGVDTFLHSLALFKRRKGEGWECYIVGDGPERPRLVRLAEWLRLKKYVHFMGRSSNPYAWLSKADIFVSPSRWESFGITIVEAMALGLPVVATATDGAKDIIADGEDGILVPVEDPEALSRAILKLSPDPDLRRQLGERAKIKAREFDASLVARQYMNLLEKLMEKRSSI